MDNLDDCQKISHHQIKLKAIHSNTYKNLSQHQELFGIYELLVLSLTICCIFGVYQQSRPNHSKTFIKNTFLQFFPLIPCKN